MIGGSTYTSLHDLPPHTYVNAKIMLTQPDVELEFGLRLAIIQSTTINIVEYKPVNFIKGFIKQRKTLCTVFLYLYNE